MPQDHSETAEKLTRSVPLREGEETHRRIKRAAKHLLISEAAVRRLTQRIGLEHLERIKYDLAGAVVEMLARERKNSGTG